MNELSTSSENMEKELCNKIFVKAMEKPESYDIFGMDQTRSVAFLPHSKNLPIKNGFIVAEHDKEVYEWEISDYKINHIPFNMQVAIKPEKAVALQYVDGNQSKYILMKSNTEFVKARIFGSVETDNDFMAFNAENGTVTYIYQKIKGIDVPIYAILKSFKDWNNNRKDENDGNK